MTTEQAVEAIDAVLKQYPYLRPNGVMGTPGDLRERPHEFIRAVNYLNQFHKQKTPSEGSYGLKHHAESQQGAYICNGALIAAAIHLGFKIKEYPDSPNVRINIGKRVTSGFPAFIHTLRTDFANDFKNDPHSPAHGESLEPVLSHLQSRNACEQAIHQAHQAYARYAKSK